MAFTPDWMWRVVDRRKDYSVTAGVESFRENWMLSRYRVSDQAYSSELGDTSSSLAGENGGVTETIAVPTGYTYLSFSGANYPYTAGVEFYSAGYSRNGQSAYIYSDPSPEDSTKSAVIFFEEGYSHSTQTWDWHFVQCSAAEATSGTFPNITTAYAAGDVLAWNYTVADITGANWKVPDVAGNFTLSEATSTLEFRCTADSQSYDQPFVDWFTQTQTWVVKSPWVS